MKHMVLLWACLSITPVAQAGELYRWVDKDGKVHYSDVPPADVTDVERKRLSGTTSQSDDLPYETRRARENFPVTLYVTSGCGAPCDQARSMLNKRGIPFSEKSLNTQKEIDEFYKMSGSNGAPTLSVGKNYLSGFLESRWNSELDAAGYPKTAGLRPRAIPPAPPATPAIPPEGGYQNVPATPAGQ